MELNNMSLEQLHIRKDELKKLILMYNYSNVKMSTKEKLIKIYMDELEVVRNAIEAHISNHLDRYDLINGELADEEVAEDIMRLNYATGGLIPSTTLEAVLGTGEGIHPLLESPYTRRVVAVGAGYRNHFAEELKRMLDAGELTFQNKILDTFKMSTEGKDREREDRQLESLRYGMMYGMPVLDTNRGIILDPPRLSIEEAVKDVKEKIGRCRVIEVDSIDGIFDAMRQASNTVIQGGGIGVDLSRLVGVNVEGYADIEARVMSEMYNTISDLVISGSERKGLSMTSTIDDSEAMDRFKKAMREASIKLTEEGSKVAVAFRSSIEKMSNDPDFIEALNKMSDSYTPLECNLIDTTLNEKIIESGVPRNRAERRHGVDKEEKSFFKGDKCPRGTTNTIKRKKHRR